MNTFFADAIVTLHALDVCSVLAADDAGMRYFREWILLGHLLSLLHPLRKL